MLNVRNITRSYPIDASHANATIMGDESWCTDVHTLICVLYAVLPLPLNGPQRLEGATLANLPAAGHDHKHLCIASWYAACVCTSASCQEHYQIGIRTRRT